MLERSGERQVMRCSLGIIAWFASMLGILSGCGSSAKNWEIVAENGNEVPCSITVIYGEDGSRHAQVGDLAQGPPQVLVAENVPTVIRSIKLVRGKDEQMLKQDMELPIGKRLMIRVDADGNLSAIVINR